MKPVGVLRFLGTNCDTDVFEAVQAVGLQAKWVWYQDQFNCDDFSAFILPGGFSYGDYLRSGALAAKMPSVKSLHEADKKGMPILGICNGFQVLCEAGLLPGALVKNINRRFIDKWVQLEAANASPNFASKISSTVNLPVAHGDGCYFIPEADIPKIKDNGQIWLNYKENINGSVLNIAGVMNKNKNVAGLMPHPERAMFDWQGGSDGKSFFESLL